MKKIILSLIVVIGILSVACDMDKKPYDKIATEDALQSIGDFSSLRNGCYAYVRTLFTGDYIIAPEIQADAVHAVVDYSNTYGQEYVWSFTAGDIGQFQTYYALINVCNLLINKGSELMPTFTAADQATLNQYMGEAYLLRALAYEELAMRFCKAYKSSTAASDLGLPLVTEYSPSGNSASYPARASLYDTYQLILGDLTEATNRLTTAGSANARYATKDAVTALRVRVALQMGDYPTCVSLAEPFLNAETYPLVNTKADFAQMWVNDNSTETIFQPFVSATELSTALGTYFINAAGSDESSPTFAPNPTFIPEQGILDMYNKANDIRFSVYFQGWYVTMSAGTAPLYLCYKYPGNPNIVSTITTKFINMFKVFRVAEVWLNYAEAATQVDEGKALEALRTLRRARILGYVDETFGGAALVNEIRKERQKEFFMEGRRLWDLKRYGEGLTRTAPQNPDFVYLNGNSTTTDINKPADDFRFVWPIPHHEVAANPQMEQNPGY
ncbi:MAG: RagB/SusD family nutrient uptake outer membrane protein [Culturomica sp.]|nr:RagB/SusD family nutrient uptake outer membrane protein [Culturomica sp.]